MKIDDLRKDLRAYEAKAEGSVRVPVAKLREQGLGRARSALGRLQIALWLELSVNLVAVVALGGFMASHLALRFLAPALALDAMAVAHVIFGAWQITALRRIDFGGPVLAVQRALETLRVKRIGMTKWTILLGPLLWIPLLVVTLEGFLGFDAYAGLDHSWLVVNVAFGVAFIPAMLLASRRLAGRFAGSPLLERLLRDIAGYNLSSARAFVGELARFEGE